MENMTLYIEPDSHDLSFDGDGNIKLIYDEDTIAQCVRVTLEVYKGEFPLDISHGTDYERIMGLKGATTDDAAGIIREAIYQEKRIKRINQLKVERETDGRIVSADVEMLTKDNNIVNVSTGTGG